MAYQIKNTRTTKEFLVDNLEEFFRRNYFIKKNYEDFLNEKYGTMDVPLLGQTGVGTIIRKTDKVVFKSNYSNWVEDQYHYVMDELLSKYNPVEFRDLVIEEI